MIKKVKVKENKEKVIYIKTLYSSESSYSINIINLKDVNSFYIRKYSGGFKVQINDETAYFNDYPDKIKHYEFLEEMYFDLKYGDYTKLSIIDYLSLNNQINTKIELNND